MSDEAGGDGPIPEYGDPYGEPALFSPADAIDAAGVQLPPAVIVGFQGILTDAVRERADPIAPDTDTAFDYRRLSDSVAYVPAHEMGLGAPIAAVAAEKAIAAGAEALVVLSGAACPDPDIPPDAALVPTRAVRDEGASYHYVPPGKVLEPAEGLSDRLAASFAGAGVETRTGPTWTTSAVFRETVPQLRRYRERGFVSVGMETAAAWAVCRYRGADAATVHHVDGYAVPGEAPAADPTGLPEFLDPAIAALESSV